MQPFRDPLKYTWEIMYTTKHVEVSRLSICISDAVFLLFYPFFVAVASVGGLFARIFMC